MKTSLLYFIFLISFFRASAQCPGCVQDITCAASKPYGGLCKGDITGMVAHPYSKDVTIYMPTLIPCAAVGKAGQCTYVELKQIKVASITSPQGLSTTPNKTTYNVAIGDTLGCIRFCGTPLTAGNFPIAINLLADIIAHGTPGGDITLTDQSFPYLDTIKILADTTPNPPLSSFNFTLNNVRKNTINNKNCDSAIIDSFNATINANCNLAQYQWTIENKGTFVGKNPNTGKLIFNTSDTFTTTLKTQLYQYRIKKVEVGSVSGGYSEIACIGAMEECPLGGKPDLYITIDVAAINGRRNCGNAECDTNLNKDANIQFNNINFIIPPSKCGTPFKLTIYDEDSAPFGTTLPFPANLAATADDKLDTYMITPTLGTITLPNGANTKSVKITFDTVPGGAPIIESMNLIIPPKITPTVVTSLQDSFCNTQTTDVSITNANNHFVEWYLDTNLLTGLNNNTIQVNKGGNYKAKLISAQGCSYTTIPKYISMLPFPDALTEYKKDTLKIQLFDLNKYNYDWYINDTVQSNAHNKPWILFNKTGFYKVKAYNKYCSDTSEPLYFQKPTTAIDAFNEPSFQYVWHQSNLSISNFEHDMIQARIFDIMGNLIEQADIAAHQKIDLDLSRETHTMFILQLKGDSFESKSIKIIR